MVEPDAGHDLGAFSTELHRLFDLEGEDFDHDDTDAIKVVVKVCCKHFPILRRYRGFTSLCIGYLKLRRSMLHYTASRGGNLLSTHPTTGDRANVD